MKKIIGKSKYDKRIANSLKVLLIKLEYRIRPTQDIKYYEGKTLLKKGYYIQ